MGARGGRASAEARRKKKVIRADLLAKAKFEGRAEDMANVLIQAALGQGDFARLDPKERAQFALKVLEYGLGRPRAMEPAMAEPVETVSGLSFGTNVPMESLDDDSRNEAQGEPNRIPEERPSLAEVARLDEEGE